MAERITGEKFGIYTKQPLDLDWRLAVCTTSISIDRSVSEIEVQDNCSGGAVGREPSVISNTLAFEGNISTLANLLNFSTFSCPLIFIVIGVI